MYEVHMCGHTIWFLMLFFFFQAEDGIRDWSVTGVQTCALPISGRLTRVRRRRNPGGRLRGAGRREVPQIQRQRAAASVVHPNGRVALAEQIRDLDRKSVV